MSDDRFDSETGRAAALARWAKEADPVSATAKARAAFLARFETEVDPDGSMPPEERAKRADRLLRAHMIRLARRKRLAR
jgi:hypothetical protein